MTDKEQCIQLKTFFGFENLHFYCGKYGRFHCKFISDPNNFDSEDLLDLKFILSSLNLQQGSIYFDDLNKECLAQDLKLQYLMFKLALL
jgi:hypothetical protein